MALTFYILIFRYKLWKPYTLSYYDSCLRKMIKLVTMESNAENASYCALFLTLVNEMLEKFMKENNQAIKIFNYSIIQRDEHFSNQNGIEAVLGHELVENRTASCEHNFEQSVEKHLKLLPTEYHQSYKTLVTSLKNAVTQEAFI